MNSIYTKGPIDVPEGLTKPTQSFKKHVWLSVMGLLLFMALYFVLTLWFGKLSYNLFMGKGGGINYLLAAGFAFLSLFMLKSLFIFRKREKDPLRKYLSAKDEPILFDYLYKLADEAGSPRPHKIFLTDRVNASVSYDLSIVNLLFPSKKNLEIGLGLVNILSLGEFKAVLAHEFGHFAQRSMLLGRYVYVAQQIAAQIVTKRDVLDKFLAGLSGIDIRIAWIGWVLSILVWAIRSLIETCFSVVAIAERALSREMEFQADLVAVSLTGSDALIHALYKLQIADQAYENALEVVNNELAKKKAIYNLYTLQSNYIKKMSWVLKDPSYGKSPEVHKTAPGQNRIFASRTYNPPKMWSTHPADKDREDNAKKNYIAAEIDCRPSKDLLSNPQKYEVDMTAVLIATAKVETALLTDEEGINIQNKKYFNWSFLNPKYNSAFLNRYPFVHFENIDELYDITLNSGSLKDEFKKIYPKNLTLKINQLKEINEEIDALIIAKNEVVTAEKRIITHRGVQIKRKDIPEILDSLNTEEKILRSELAAHDKLCRTVHFEAAKKMENGWADYLKKLATLVHYSEHSITNLNDCIRKFHNVLNVALADGRVSSSELLEILDAANDYYYTVKKVYGDSASLKLDEVLLKKMELKSYKEAFEKFTLGAPNKEIIDQWINVIDGWATGALNVLNELRNVALEQLLDTEDYIKEAFLNGSKSSKALSNTIKLPERYKSLTPGNERPIQRKLSFWNRFFIGDGLYPSMARFGISGAMVLGALFLGNYSQKSTLYIYNGLNIGVAVTIDNQIIEVDPNSYETIPINYGTDYTITTTTTKGEKIEELASDFDDPSKEYIYNIANAATFVEYPVFYGYNGALNSENTYLGAKKWFSSSADYILEEPPKSISLSSGSSGERKEVLVGYAEIQPSNLLSIVNDSVQAQKMISAHVLWDSSKSKYLLEWMNQLYNITDAHHILRERLKRNVDEVAALRALQNTADSIQKIKICEEQQQKATKHPENPNFYYLSCRCIENETEKGDAFIKGFKQWQDNAWLAFAAAFTYAERGYWKKSYNAFLFSKQSNPAIAEMITMDMERVRRVLLKKTNSATYKNPVSNNQDIEFYNALEKGTLENMKENPNNAFYLLSKGKLQEANTFISNFENFKPYILRFLAASKGASDEMIHTAIELPNDAGINYNTIWLALGLAIKEKSDITAYTNTINKMGVANKILNKFLKHIEHSEFEKAEEAIKGLNFELKAHFYVLANVILNNKIPENWKEYIRTILFIDQRPFL